MSLDFDALLELIDHGVYKRVLAPSRIEGFRVLIIYFCQHWTLLTPIHGGINLFRFFRIHDCDLIFIIRFVCMIITIIVNS